MQILLSHPTFQELYLSSFERYGPAREGEPVWMDFLLRETDEDRTEGIVHSDRFCQFGMFTREHGVEVILRAHPEDKDPTTQPILEANSGSIFLVIEKFIRDSYRRET